MDEQARSESWWVRTQAGEFGPVDIDTVRGWVHQGRITPTDFVRRAEADAWVPAADVAELARFFPVQFAAPGAAPRKGLRVGCIVALVVGIAGVLGIAILAALLLPALEHAKQRARQIVCMSNYRQLGMALAVYTNQFDDRTPYSMDSLDSGDGTFLWMHQLYGHGYVDNTSVFQCPSTELDEPWDGTSAVRVDTPFSVSINDWGWGDLDGGTGLGIMGVQNWPESWVDFFSIVKPPEFIIMADSITDADWDAVVDPSIDDPGERPADRHFGTATIVFADGHVDKYEPYPNTRGDNVLEQRERSHLWRRNHETKP